MSKYINLVIFVSDALRYDHFPKELRNGKKVIPTLAPSLHSPTSFASLHTARKAENHNVSSFLEDLDPEIKTSFNFFPNKAFYDSDGAISSVKKHIFTEGEVKDIHEMEEPFIWVERIMDTHAPYGTFSNNNEINQNIQGSEYLDKAREGAFKIKEDYHKGVENMTERVKKKIDYLEEEGLLDDTLVIITSDHGDALGEKYLGRRRYGHNFPMMKEIAVVPTVFYNHRVNAEAMRTIDILPTALGIMGIEESIGDGVDIRRDKIEEGWNIMKDPKAYYKSKWVFENGNWKITDKSRAIRFLKTMMGDIKKKAYHRGGKQILEKLEEKSENDCENDSEVQGIEV